MATRTAAPKPGTTSSVPLSQLATFHRNARQGDVPTIAASLRANGQYKPIVANIGTHTGRPNEVLAGNHTLMAARDLAEDPEVGQDWAKILVHWVDVDDDRANRIVIADNKTAELGGYDNDLLFELVDSLGGDLDGTGFTELDVEDLAALVQEHDLPKGGDPFDTGDKEPRTGDDGLIDTKDVDEQKDSYADTATRLVILTLPISRFVWAQEQLAKYRAVHDLESNTDALVLLLEDWSGEDAPAIDAEVSDEAVEEAANL